VTTLSNTLLLGEQADIIAAGRRKRRALLVLVLLLSLLLPTAAAAAAQQARRATASDVLSGSTVMHQDSDLGCWCWCWCFQVLDASAGAGCWSSTTMLLLPTTDWQPLNMNKVWPLGRSTTSLKGRVNRGSGQLGH
jgi:hypothetical protein